jgi:hypothetical protein
VSADLEGYTKLLADRPAKFDDSEVDYRESQGKEKCGRCIHLFSRKLDGFNVCEVFRNDEIDNDGIDPEYVCDFFTRDGEVFPLLKEGEQHGDNSDDED